MRLTCMFTLDLLRLRGGHEAGDFSRSAAKEPHRNRSQEIPKMFKSVGGLSRSIATTKGERPCLERNGLSRKALNLRR